MNFGAPGFIALAAQAAGGVPAVPQDAPKAVFRYGEQSIWSTQWLDGGTSQSGQQYRLFSTQGGQQGQGFTSGGLSLAETNLKLPGQVPGGVAYDVFGVACQILGSTRNADGTGANAGMNQAMNDPETISNLINVLQNGVFSWDFTQTTVQIAPCMLIGAGGGAFGAVSTTQNAQNVGAMNNGAGSVWLYRTYPVALPGTTVFGIVLQFGTRAPSIGVALSSQAKGIAVRCVLLGYYKNLVEVG